MKKEKHKKVWFADKEIDWFVKQFNDLQKQNHGTLLRLGMKCDDLHTDKTEKETKKLLKTRKPTELEKLKEENIKLKEGIYDLSEALKKSTNKMSTLKEMLNDLKHSS